jgi:hypothetical protein
MSGLQSCLMMSLWEAEWLAFERKLCAARSRSAFQLACAVNGRCRYR